MVVAHAFNPSTMEEETDRFLGSRPAWSTGKFQDSQGYAEKLSLGEKKKYKILKKLTKVNLVKKKKKKETCCERGAGSISRTLAFLRRLWSAGF